MSSNTEQPRYILLDDAIDAIQELDWGVMDNSVDAQDAMKKLKSIAKPFLPAPKEVQGEVENYATELNPEWVEKAKEVAESFLRDNIGKDIKDHEIHYLSFSYAQVLQLLTTPFYTAKKLHEQYASRHPAPAGMQWRTDNYEGLYHVIESGKRVVAFVDYQPMNGRDICTIKSPNWEFSARGIGYGSWAGDKPTVEMFLRICEKLNVEWLDENVKEHSAGEDWIVLKDDCEMPDYDEPVLWFFEDGITCVNSLDKDGNPWLYGIYTNNGATYPKATHWKRFKTPE